MEELFAEHGLPRPVIAVSADSIIQVQTMIASNDLLALLPTQLLPTFEGVSIIRVPIREKIRPVRLCLIAKANQSLSMAAQQFAAIVKKRAKVVAEILAKSRLLVPTQN